MTYVEALAKIREDAAAETETGLQAIDPLDHDAMLDLVLELASRVTCLEKDKAHRHMAYDRKTPDGWEPA